MPVTVDVLTRALKAREAFESWASIAARERVPLTRLKEAVRRRCRALGLPTTTTGRGWWRPIPQATREAVVAAAADPQATLAQIALRAGASRSQVRRVLEDARVNRPPPLPDSLMQTREVAALLQMQPRTLGKLIAASLKAKIPLPCVDVGVGRRRIWRWEHIDDIKAWLQRVQSWRQSTSSTAAPSCGGAKGVSNARRPLPRGQKRRKKPSGTKADLLSG